eukprot:UN5144
MIQSRVEPNVVTFSAVISACEKGGQWLAALTLLSSMIKLGIVPNVVSCNAAVSTCEKSGQWLVALALLSSMAWLHIEPTVVKFQCSAQCLREGQPVAGRLDLVALHVPVAC